MDQEAIAKFKEAGKLAATCLNYGKELIEKKDKTILEVLDLVEQKIEELGGKPAFPAQISCNHIAAHFCPDDKDTTPLTDQVVCLDVGVHVDGYIGDNAVTVDLSGEHADLVTASREALNNVVKQIAVGVKVSELGKTIQETIQSYGFAPVRNLSGHGLGHYAQHTGPSIPNFDNHDQTTVKEGMTFAVEPFASSGAGIVQDSGIATVFMLEQKKPTRSQMTRKVLAALDNYNGLPFTTRWLTKQFGNKALIALREMQQYGMIHAYPPLADRDKGLVSQAEHSFLIDDDGKVHITTKL